MWLEGKMLVLGHFLQNMHEFKCVIKRLVTHSVHFFGGLLGVVLAGDVGESDVLLRCALLVTYFSLHVEPDHDLIDQGSDDGTEKRGKNGHQEPAISNREE